MTFRLDLVNRAGLFRNYAAWHEDNNFADPSHVIMAHHIGSLVQSIERMFMLREECQMQFNEFEGNLNLQGDEILFHSPSMFDLISSISTFLSSVRLSQNALMNILGQHLKKSLPSSMSDFLKSHHKYAVPKEITTLILNYWNRGGRKAKEYRDVDQHFGLVARHAWIIRGAKLSQARIYLADNPKEKSPTKFTYVNKHDAFDFATEAFDLLHALINDVSSALGYLSPRAFDFNIEFSDVMTECLMITFDPQKSIFLGHEIFLKDGSHCAQNLFKTTDLTKYSFLKYNRYFEKQYTFERDFELSAEPAILSP